jgi:uncharacterized membrane protein YhaH (DUF805 family)
VEDKVPSSYCGVRAAPLNRWSAAMAIFWWNFYFSSRGRTGLKLYWLFGVVPLVASGFLMGFIVGLFRLTRDDLRIPLAIVLPQVLWMWVCVGARRLHDIGLSGWWMVLV